MPATVFRAEYDVDVVADVRTGHCVVPSGLIYLNLMLPGTGVRGSICRTGTTKGVKSGDLISILRD
jgi:hypothetical protein